MSYYFEYIINYDVIRTLWELQVMVNVWYGK